MTIVFYFVKVTLAFGNLYQSPCLFFSRDVACTQIGLIEDDYGRVFHVGRDDHHCLVVSSADHGAARIPRHLGGGADGARRGRDSEEAEGGNGVGRQEQAGLPAKLRCYYRTG